MDHFINTFNSVVNKHTPFKKQRIKDRSNPWFTSELSSLYQVKNKAWTQARKSGDPLLWLAFKQLRNKFTSFVRKAKYDYYLNTISIFSSNPAKFWKVVNSTKNKHTVSLPSHVTYNQHLITDHLEICTAFNKHFAAAGHLFKNGNMGSGESINCPESDVSVCTVRYIPQFTLQLYTPNEVSGALLAIDSKKATGEDTLDPFSLRLSALTISECVTHIFHLTILSGTIPKVLKVAHVTPLQKEGDINDLNNYRPISKLSCLSKILESLVNNRAVEVNALITR